MDPATDEMGKGPIDEELLEEDMAGEGLPCPSHGRERWKVSSTFWRYLLVFVATALVFLCIGLYAGNHGVRLPFGQDPDSLDMLGDRMGEAARMLEKDALEEYELEEATDATMKALLESNGDKYADYYNPDYYKTYLSVTSGSYEGIGIALSNYGSYVLVTYVYPDSAAEAAGIEPGDAIVSVDGEERAWTAEEVVDALKRDDGQTVDIGILRPTDESLDALIEAVRSDFESDDEDADTASEVVLEGESLVVTAEFGTVDILSVEHEMIDDVGYIGLYRFNKDSTERVSEAIDDLSSQGAKALVLDLRGDGGGYVDQAVGIVSLFVAEGDVLQLKEKSGTKTKEVSGSVETDLPLVVLVDGRSASSSEIVTAALKDHGRATIVGTTTYGKGTIQAIAPLSFGGAIKYTIAEYLSPDGNAINGVGVVPDIVVEQSESYLDGTSDVDVQLDRAVEVARSLADGQAE